MSCRPASQGAREVPLAMFVCCGCCKRCHVTELTALLAHGQAGGAPNGFLLSRKHARLSCRLARADSGIFPGPLRFGLFFRGGISLCGLFHGRVLSLLFVAALLLLCSMCPIWNRHMLPTSDGRLLATQAREARFSMKHQRAANCFISTRFIGGPLGQDFPHLLCILGALVVLRQRDRGMS